MNAVKKYRATFRITLFHNNAKLVLFTIIPTALMGAILAEFIAKFMRQTPTELLLGLVVRVFRLGLKRYESGSAIQVEV